MTGQRLYSVSASKINSWLDCPRKFWFQYVQRAPVSGTWAHLSMGNSIHDVLRDWWDEPTHRRSRSTMAQMMAVRWRPLGFRDDAHSSQWRDAAASMTWHYVQQLPHDFTPVSCERTLGARTARVSLTGRIDRLDSVEDSNELVVVDYKTGKRVPGEDEVRGSMALAIYALCVQQSLKRPCTRVELHHVPSGAIVGWQHQPDALSRHIARVESISAEMEQAQAGSAEDFPASPSSLCGWCDFRDRCPQGQQAAAQQLPWAGLPEALDALPMDAGPEGD
jgi:RecB family exonuclease